MIWSDVLVYGSNKRRIVLNVVKTLKVLPYSNLLYPDFFRNYFFELVAHTIGMQVFSMI